MKLTDTTLQAILTALIATGKPFDPAALFVGVATAIDDRGSATSLAEVTEATGALATRVEVTAWGTPYKLADGSWVVQGPECAFRPASSAEGQFIAGWFMASLITAGVLKAFAMIAPPVNLVNEFSQLTIIPRVRVDPAGKWSAEVIFNG